MKCPYCGSEDVHIERMKNHDLLFATCMNCKREFDPYAMPFKAKLFIFLTSFFFVGSPFFLFFGGFAAFRGALISAAICFVLSLCCSNRKSKDKQKVEK